MEVESAFDVEDLEYGDDGSCLPQRKVPQGDIYEASRAGDTRRLKVLLSEGVDVNLRDPWDSVPLYYACLAGHVNAVILLLEAGAICSENTFDGDRCHYASLTLRIRRILKTYEMRPPPLAPLPRILRECFDNEEWWPDTIFHISNSKIRCHRAILSSRSSYFRKAFAEKWKNKREIRFANPLLTFSSLYSLLSFFYSDRLEVHMEDMEDLARICHVCKCNPLKEIIERELVHQKYAKHKSIRPLQMEDEEESQQKRFILQGSSVPSKHRLHAAMESLFDNLTRHIPDESLQSQQTFTPNSKDDHHTYNGDDSGPNENTIEPESLQHFDHINIMKRLDLIHIDSNVIEEPPLQHADASFHVGDCVFKVHRFILAARSDYFKALFSRTSEFQEGRREQKGRGKNGHSKTCSQAYSDVIDSRNDFSSMDEHAIPVFTVKDLNPYAFKKLLEFIYTDKIREIIPDQAEHVLEAASRYLLFPLKRAVADCLLPLLECSSLPEICQWLLLSEMYDVWKMREYCLDCMASNFESFAKLPEFCLMLRTLPSPSGDSALRTTAPSEPGKENTVASSTASQANVLDDLREKWLELEGAELEARDWSALEFDKRLMQLANQELHFETID